MAAPKETEPKAPLQKPVNKTVARARDKLMWDLTWLQREGLVGVEVREAVPLEWHTLEVDCPTEEKKEKVTLYLDRSVARFFKAMGTGYQARINRLLRVWAQMKIAEEVAIDDALRERLDHDFGLREEDKAAKEEAEASTAPR